jgi:feruloyl esterase
VEKWKVESKLKSGTPLLDGEGAKAMRNRIGQWTVAVFVLMTALSAVGYSEERGRLSPADCAPLKDLTIPASAIGLPTSGAVVQTAVAVGADQGHANGDFCKVMGIVKPKNSTSPNLEFEVNLPYSWNGRALQMGGGGYDGSLVTGLTPFTLQPANTPTPQRRRS